MKPKEIDQIKSITIVNGENVQNEDRIPNKTHFASLASTILDKLNKTSQNLRARMTTTKKYYILYIYIK